MGLSGPTMKIVLPSSTLQAPLHLRRSPISTESEREVEEGTTELNDDFDKSWALSLTRVIGIPVN